MQTDEQLMSQRESLLKHKYKYDGCFIFYDGIFYGEGLNEENTRNICTALNEMADRHENDRNIKMSDVKYFLSLLFDLKEVRNGKDKINNKLIGSDKQNINLFKKHLIKNNPKNYKKRGDLK